MRNQEVPVKTQIPHLSFLNEEIKKNSGMSTTDIFNNPRFVANNFLEELKNSAQNGFNKRYFFGEVLRLLGWFASRTITIKQNSLHFFNKSMTGENKDLLMEYLIKDYDSSRELMLKGIMDYSYFAFPNEIRLNWVDEWVIQNKREHTKTGDDSLAWGETIRLNVGPKKEIIFEGRGRSLREGSQKIPHYIYQRDFSHYPDPVAYEEIYYRDNRLPLASMSNSFHSTNSDKYSNVALPGIQILVRSNNPKYAYVLINFDSKGNVEKHNIDSDPFFEGDKKKIQEMLLRTGVPGENEFKDLDPKLLKETFIQFASEGKEIGHEFYQAIIGEKYIEPKIELPKTVNPITRDEWNKIFSHYDKISLPFLNTNISQARRKIIRARIKKLDESGKKAAIDLLLQAVNQYINEYFVFFNLKIMSQTGEFSSYRNVFQAIKELKLAIADLERYVEESRELIGKSDRIKSWIVETDESLKSQIEALRKTLNLPSGFNDISWLHGENHGPILGVDYFHLNGETGKIDYRKPIEKDHYQYLSRISSDPIYEKETNPPDRLVETLSLNNRYDSRISLYYIQNPSGKITRRITLTTVSSNDDFPETYFTFYEDGKFDIGHGGTGGNPKIVEESKQELIKNGFVSETEIQLNVDFNKTWEAFIEKAKSGIVPTNIFDVLILQ